jgi:transcriptional regulator with XRE-family HTH domain
MLSPIALLFKNARERLGVSQAAIAKACGYTPAFITQVESGRSVPDIKKAAAIAKALNVSEQAVIDAIMGTKFPDLKLVTAPMKRYGWFVEFSPLEYKRLVAFSESEYEEPSALIRRVVLRYLDAKEGRK